MIYCASQPISRNQRVGIYLRTKVLPLLGPKEMSISSKEQQIKNGGIPTVHNFERYLCLLSFRPQYRPIKKSPLLILKIKINNFIILTAFIKNKVSPVIFTLKSYVTPSRMEILLGSPCSNTGGDSSASVISGAWSTLSSAEHRVLPISFSAIHV